MALPGSDVFRWKRMWEVVADADLGRPIEAFADMTKSRALGFQSFRRSDDTFRNTFAELKAPKIVP